MGYIKVFQKAKKKINVLIACSDELRRKALTDYISGSDLYVEKTTSDGKSTLKAIIENDFAAAVIYLGLPGNDGLWVLEELKKLNDKVTDIQLTLENETNKNIKIIAEGHLDLSRKLDEALKVDSEKEMLMIRVNRLENELRRLKARVEEIA